MPRLARLDPLTGTPIRARKTTAVRYERDHPGELVHMDVKKIGRIPDGGGWRAHGREGSQPRPQQTRIGYDYVHSLVDDHSRLAYSEILADEKGPTCAAFLIRAADYFADHGIARIERVMTDNAWAYRVPRLAAASPPSAPATGSSNRTAPGRTAKSNDSTAPCKPNGPTGRSSPATPNAPPRLHPGSSTTTLNAATPHSAASHPSAAYHQPDGWVHLAGWDDQQVGHGRVDERGVDRVRPAAGEVPPYSGDHPQLRVGYVADRPRLVLRREVEVLLGRQAPMPALGSRPALPRRSRIRGWRRCRRSTRCPAW